MIRQHILTSLLAIGLICTLRLLAAGQATEGYTKQQIIDLVNRIPTTSSNVPQKLTTQLNTMNESISDASFEEKLDRVIRTLLTIKIKPEDRAELTQIHTALLKKLSKYKASGSSFCRDWNGAFFVDGQNPQFTVTYKDAAGNTKKRSYQANINLVGINIELTLRLNLVFMTDSNFNFSDSNKVIELGKGIQFSPTSSLLFLIPAAFDFTYVPFLNAPGGLIIVSLILGPKIGGISMVTGGTLKPVD